MARVVPKKLGQAAVGVTASTLYTVTAPVISTFLKDVEICNTSSTTATTVTVYLVPSGGTEGTSNEFIPATILPPNGMFQWTGSVIMNTGDFIRIIAGATGCTIYASGGEYQ